MQFSIMTVLALAAVAIASPAAFDKRQTVSNDIPVNAPAMTDAQGNVVPFSSKDVHLGSKRGVYINKRF